MALQMCHDPQFTPEVLLMDLHMPRMDGFELLSQLQSFDAAPRALILSGDNSADNTFRALSLGATGYLLKDNVTEESIVSAVLAVAEGCVCVDDEILHHLLNARPRIADTHTLTLELSESEITLLRDVAQGHNNKTIAAKRDITTKTVSNRLSLLYERLGIQNRVQAAIFTLRNGLIDIDDIA